MIVAFVTTMMQGRRVAGVVELGVGYTTFVGLMIVDHGFDLGIATALAAWLTVLLTGSELVRARRDRAREQDRSREEEARRRVTEERLRIARELHDVVAHNISLVNLQAGVALHLLDQQPEQARTALATIKDASKEALVELRSVLGVLRQVDEDEDAPRAPTPGLARLDDLVAQCAAAGVEVRVTTDGPSRALAPGLDLAAFRIVQEALTNVARHAGPTTARVRLSYGEDALVVEVDDDGRRAGAVHGARLPDATLGSGHGLAGMRERAEAAGGSVVAGPRPGFGWQVRAQLPYTPSPGPSGPPPAEPADAPAPSPAGGRA
jgi:signal transduction histidine kinase